MNLRVRMLVFAALMAGISGCLEAADSLPPSLPEAGAMQEFPALTGASIALSNTDLHLALNNTGTMPVNVDVLLDEFVPTLPSTYYGVQAHDAAHEMTKRSGYYKMGWDRSIVSVEGLGYNVSAGPSTTLLYSAGPERNPDWDVSVTLTPGTNNIFVLASGGDATIRVVQTDRPQTIVRVEVAELGPNYKRVLFSDNPNQMDAELYVYTAMGGAISGGGTVSTVNDNNRVTLVHGPGLQKSKFWMPDGTLCHGTSFIATGASDFPPGEISFEFKFVEAPYVMMGTSIILQIVDLPIPDVFHYPNCDGVIDLEGLP